MKRCLYNWPIRLRATIISCMYRKNQTHDATYWQHLHRENENLTKITFTKTYLQGNDTFKARITSLIKLYFIYIKIHN